MNAFTLKILLRYTEATHEVLEYLTRMKTLTLKYGNLHTQCET